MNHYRFRAECERDFLQFKSQLQNTEYRIHPYGGGLPDIEVEIFTLLNVEIVRQLFLTVQDCHVMAETLAVATEYTGERTYQNMVLFLSN